MITKELYFTSNENPTYTLLIKGLSGGHSGGEIHRGKGNANKLAARVMYGMIKANLDIQLVDLNGGLKNNAIPRECAIVLLVQVILSYFRKWQMSIKIILVKNLKLVILVLKLSYH